MVISCRKRDETLRSQLWEAIPPHLATLIHKAKLESVACASSYRCNFSGYPTLLLIGEPNAGSFAVDVFGHLISREP